MNICWPEEGPHGLCKCPTNPVRWIPTKTVPVLPSGNQERRNHDGCQDLVGPSVERTDCSGGGKAGGLPRGAPGRAGVPQLLHSGREHISKQLLQRAHKVRSGTSSPCLDLSRGNSCSLSVDTGIIGMA